MGLTASSMALADFAVPRPCRSTLDVGSGSGIQAFLAAPHSQQVWGVDRSGRSIEFARFNAGLNGITNCEFIEGNAFEPVRGRTFDLVVSNPPFAVTPSVRYMYRDSGVELDGFCRNLVRQAPEFLNEGGIFQFCCDWAHLAGEGTGKSGWRGGSKAPVAMRGFCAPTRRAPPITPGCGSATPNMKRRRAAPGSTTSGWPTTRPRASRPSAPG